MSIMLANFGKYAISDCPFIYSLLFWMSFLAILGRWNNAPIMSPYIAQCALLQFICYYN